jgi:hypothetical protein
MKDLESDLSSFIENEKWTFAKTYAKTWPHEYIVEENVDSKLFIKLAEYIDTFGHQEYFYSRQMTYLYFSGHAYWHMENIINRCLLGDTYEQREKDGRLPIG